ncbi:MAG: hypothetical protein J0H01_05270 [Rhizobiales bacterium]|nr:hypothetical protein [Hyphomicrobiales bacterium]
MPDFRLSGAGGTPGGLIPFFVGLGMTVAGAYLFTTQVTVSGGSWTLGGYSAFGLSLVPLLFGIGMLFFDGASRLGFLLLFAGVVIIVAGILTNLTIYFVPTSLFNTLIMLGLLAGGIGVVLKSLR